MSEIVFRNAVSDDIPFLVKAIIEAEKSGTDILTYSTIFGLTAEESAKYIGNMLVEEIDGCELSVSSFLIAEKDGKTAGAISAWIEGSAGVSSSLLKANLLKYVLPEHCFLHMLEINPIIQELYIENIDNTFQLGAGFVPQEYRGERILSKLIAEAIRRLSLMKPEIDEIYAQIYSTNIPSIRSVEKEGFSIVLEKESLDHRIFEYLPSNRKVLVKKVLSTNN